MKKPRQPTGHQPTIAEEVQAKTGDADLTAAVDLLERAFGARTVHAGVNGKGEAIWTKIRRALAIVATVVGAIFFAGDEWGKMRRSYSETLPKLEKQMLAICGEGRTPEECPRLNTLSGSVERLANELSDAIRELEKIQRSDEWYRRNPPRPPRLESGGGS